MLYVNENENKYQVKDAEKVETAIKIASRYALFCIRLSYAKTWYDIIDKYVSNTHSKRGKEHMQHDRKKSLVLFMRLSLLLELREIHALHVALERGSCIMVLR